MTNKDNQSKPFFKKAWFWAIVLIVIVGMGVATNNKGPEKVGQTDESEASSSQKTSEEDKNIFTVGDVVSLDGVELTVASAERNWKSSNEFSTPDEGKEFVRVHVVIENKTDDKISYNSMEWKMEDSTGDIKGNDFAVDDDALNSGDLAKGGKKTGTIVFEVPEGDNGLKLHYSPILSNKEVVFNL